MKYVVLAVLALFMCTQIGWSYQPSQEFVSVTVEPGQTVWQLASVAAGDDTDVRQVMDSIFERKRPDRHQRHPSGPGPAPARGTGPGRTGADGAGPAAGGLVRIFGNL